MLSAYEDRQMSENITSDQARRLFAEKTDASADLGHAPDAAMRMAEINARHEAAVAHLRDGGKPRPRSTEELESRSSDR